MHPSPPPLAFTCYYADIVYADCPPGGVKKLGEEKGPPGVIRPCHLSREANTTVIQPMPGTNSLTKWR